MLVLFDIDGTLLIGDGIGLRAMQEAGRDLFGPPFTAEGVAYAGRLDPLIVADLFEANGVEPTIDRQIAFRLAYSEAMQRSLEAAPVRRLRGALELAAALEAEPEVTVGVLTGNYPETGMMKLRSADIPIELFRICVWGDDSPSDPPHRDHLPPVALRQYAELLGPPPAAERVLIIGDTPGDIGCAQAGGHQSLAVATGRHSAATLTAHGATRVVEDLADVEGLHGWVLETLETGR